MKILIAGGNGQVGTDLSMILSKNFFIYGSYRKKKPKLKKIRWLNIDFKNKIKTNIKPDIIINCLATHEFSKKKILLIILILILFHY